MTASTSPCPISRKGISSTLEDSRHTTRSRTATSRLPVSASWPSAACVMDLAKSCRPLPLGFVLFRRRGTLGRIESFQHQPALDGIVTAPRPPAVQDLAAHPLAQLLLRIGVRYPLPQ